MAVVGTAVQSIIKFDSVNKSYGTYQAVKNLSLEIFSGELFSFLGVNGAGKTTSIKLLNGLIKPDSGEIIVAGLNLKDEVNAVRAITGYVPDRPYLFEKLTAREILVFAGSLYGIAKPEIESRSSQLLSDFGLITWADELLESYSHGMRQRMAFCVSLINKPQILLLDEPFNALDPHGAKFLKDFLLNFTKSGGTVFLNTHSLHLAEELSTRLAIIHKGELIAQGTPQEIRIDGDGRCLTLEEAFINLTR